MNIFPILQLLVHYHIHRQTQIDPMNSLNLPPQYGLISTDEIQSRDEMRAIIIKFSNKVFNKFTQILLMAHTLISHIWMRDPLNMPPQNIEMVPTHDSFAKISMIPVR